MEVKKSFESFYNRASKGDVDARRTCLSMLMGTARWFIDRRAGVGTSSELFHILSTAKEWRLCGGFVLDFLRQDTTEEYASDIDIFVVCEDREKITKACLSKLGGTVSVNHNPDGTIHDLKMYWSCEVVVDLVFRDEVDECRWIDVPCCKSGVYWKGEHSLELYDYSLVKKGVIKIPDVIKPRRLTKFREKGFEVVMT